MTINVYKLQKGAAIRVTIPEQYAKQTMFVEGVETDVLAYSSARIICGTFEGMPKGTSGFYFKPAKPIDGKLWLLAIETEVRAQVTLKDMVQRATI